MARHLSPRDVVPRLRADLNVSAAPAGAGAEVIRVGPIDSADRVALHGFEFQIAQMLDGKRTVADVVRACERLGLPVELASLESFFEQLDRWGLLRREQLATERARAEWRPAVRNLFRSAMHEARNGELDAARADLDQLLALAPATKEALALRRWLDAQPAGAPVDGTFEQLRRDVEQGWGEDLRLARVGVHRAKGPIIALAAVLAVAIATALVPLPRVVTGSATLAPAAEVPVASPFAGIVGEVLVREGDRVEAGQVLFSWDANELDLRLFMAQRRLELAREPVRAAAGETASGTEWWAFLQEAQLDSARARAALWAEVAESVGTVSQARVQRAVEELDDAQARIDAAGAALDVVAMPESVDALRARRYTLELAALEQQRARLEVRAPAAGQVTHLRVQVGQAVSPGQPLAQVDDLSRLKVVMTTTARSAAPIQVGEPATLRFGAVRAKTTIEAVSGYQLGAEIDNPGGRLKTGSAPLNIELAPRSIFQRLLD